MRRSLQLVVASAVLPWLVSSAAAAAPKQCVGANLLAFKAFARQYGKTYDSPAEYTRRCGNFLEVWHHVPMRFARWEGPSRVFGCVWRQAYETIRGFNSGNPDGSFRVRAQPPRTSLVPPL
jgi:hypothetical protein